jgi:hypothetical protein
MNSLLEIDFEGNPIENLPTYKDLVKSKFGNNISLKYTYLSKIVNEIPGLIITDNSSSESVLQNSNKNINMFDNADLFSIKTSGNQNQIIRPQTGRIRPSINSFDKSNEFIQNPLSNSTNLKQAKIAVQGLKTLISNKHIKDDSFVNDPKLNKEIKEFKELKTKEEISNKIRDKSQNVSSKMNIIFNQDTKIVISKKPSGFKRDDNAYRV